MPQTQSSRCHIVLGTIANSLRVAKGNPKPPKFLLFFSKLDCLAVFTKGQKFGLKN